jgi:AcrR family transcriptional regulator
VAATTFQEVTTMAQRMSAQDRRAQVISAAIAVFARFGYEGATTSAIAERVGVSQPYLFRLFATKKELFLAAGEQNMDATIRLLREAAGGKTGHDAMEAMAIAYQEMIVTDRDQLLMQLQTFAACHDGEIQRQTRVCLQKTWQAIEDLTGLPIEDRTLFFAKGMFCNVIAAAGRLDEEGEHDPQWLPILDALRHHAHDAAA